MYTRDKCRPVQKQTVIMTAHVICYNNLVSLTAVSTLPYSGAGEVPI